MFFQFRKVLQAIREEAKETRVQAVRDFMNSQSYQVALDTAKAAEFTSGFEHCIDMLLDLGRKI